MKPVTKIVFSIVTTLMFFACSNDDNQIKNHLTNGYWKTNIAIEYGKSSQEKTSNENVNILFQLNEGFLNVYIQEKEETKAILTEKYPAKYLSSENVIQLYHPNIKDKLISKISLDDKNNFLGKSVNYISDDFKNYQKDKKEIAARTSWIVCRACHAACRAVHRLLTLDEELDAICCFYLDC